MTEKPNFGKLNKTERLEEYDKDSWIQFFVKNNVFQGKIGEINYKTGEITFNALTSFIHNKKGYVLDIVEIPEKFLIADIDRHRQSSEEEVKTAIENQSPFYSRIGKYVSIPASGSTYTGKVHKIFRDNVELLPCVNYTENRAYIEKENPICVHVSSAGSIIPRTKEDLEYLVKEYNKPNSNT